MTPDQIKLARTYLRLSRSQLANMLETDAQTIQRMEMRSDASTARRPAPRMLRLIEAYMGGFRPSDWPTK
jgi:DNA-binding transcriptional regulator YiaG